MTKLKACGFTFVLLIAGFGLSTALAQSGRQAAPAKNGIVVSAHYLASEAGRDVLANGGPGWAAVLLRNIREHTGQGGRAVPSSRLSPPLGFGGRR